MIIHMTMSCVSLLNGLMITIIAVETINETYVTIKLTYIGTKTILLIEEYNHHFYGVFTALFHACVPLLQRVNTCDVIASARNLVYRPVPSNSVASSNKGLTCHNIYPYYNRFFTAHWHDSFRLLQSECSYMKPMFISHVWLNKKETWSRKGNVKYDVLKCKGEYSQQRLIFLGPISYHEINIRIYALKSMLIIYLHYWLILYSRITYEKLNF
jgi:hypothetical protein